jgi:AcrR family transcriptional regulator
VGTAGRAYVQRRRAATRSETRARILGAARELIPGAGNSLPVTAIAQHAGVAVQTIYDQFGSKGGLLVAVVNDVQRSSGLFESLGTVFRSPDGEEAMRRMIAATMSLWSDAWPYLEFMIRARRTDPVVSTEMDFVDRLRHAHYWCIARRIEEEGRIRDGRGAEWAADLAFALTIPTVFEELAVRRSMPSARVIEAIEVAILGSILEPRSVAVTNPPPDWPALEAEAAARARSSGADPERLTPEWQTAKR